MTRRLIPAADTFQSRMWDWMRRRRSPWTSADVVDGSGTSERQARRYIARLADAGYITSDDDERPREGGAFLARRWRLARNTGPLPPILTGGAHGEGISDPNGELTGAQLARIRQDLGLSMADFAARIGVRDPRTVRRYERCDRVPAPIVARARALQ